MCSSIRPSSTRARVSSVSTSSVIRRTSWSVSSSAAMVSGAVRGSVSECSTPTRITVSGVLSSWLASAMNRRKAEKLVSRRAIIALRVWASRSISSPASGGAGRRRCRLRPSVIASSSSIIRPSGCSARAEST